MSDIQIHLFGYDVNVSKLARKNKFTDTKGWKIFEQQNNCKHTFKTLYIALFSEISICSNCGKTQIDTGEPE